MARVFARITLRAARCILGSLSRSPAPARAACVFGARQVKFDGQLTFTRTGVQPHQFASGGDNGSKVVVFVEVYGFEEEFNRHVYLFTPSPEQPGQPAYAVVGNATAIVIQYSQGASGAARRKNCVFALTWQELVLASYLRCLAADEILKDIPAAQRPDEVARHSIAETFRGALHFDDGEAGMMSLAAMANHVHLNPARETYTMYGVDEPNAGELYTIILLRFRWGPRFYGLMSRFYGPGHPASVNTAGQVTPGDGNIPSALRIGLFQFAPANAPQTQKVLADAQPAPFLEVTSYITRRGPGSSWSAVRWKERRSDRMTDAASRARAADGP